MPKSQPKIYQLKITLCDSKPPIWRRVLITSDRVFADLHVVIQLAMGWENSHLHDFSIGHGSRIGDVEFDDGFGDEMLDETETRLDRIFTREKQKVTYTYDFGDSWEHIILLEKILPFDAKTPIPQCVKGKRACPPEDCGGIWGYEEFLAAISDPSHPDHEGMRDWIGDEFDPEAFDLDETNRLLRQYCR